MGMSWELKLMIVTAIFVLEWIIASFFKGASIGNKIYDEQMEEFNKGVEKDEESIHNTDK